MNLVYETDVGELYHHGIKGMKWGVRRYQNPDGSLTAAGKARYGRDVQENLSKKKDNRIDTSNPDPSRWVSEDISRTKDVVDSTKSTIKATEDLLNSTSLSAASIDIDLSSMSDQELRTAINRLSMEQQYTRLISNTQAQSSGKTTVSEILSTAGSVLGVASSALAIAISIKKLMG